MDISIRALRIQAGKTQEEVSDAIGVSKRTLIRWEQGNADNIPHGRYVRLLGYLYKTIRLKKEITMAQDYGSTRVVFDDPNQEEDHEDYNVPIPEDLTTEFKPSQPVTDQQMLAWAVKHVEPYPGFAREYDAWDKAWAEIASQQREKDSGHEDLRVPSIHPDPEQDERGNPINYTDEPIIHEVNNTSDPHHGTADVYIPQSSQNNDPQQTEEV